MNRQYLWLCFLLFALPAQAEHEDTLMQLKQQIHMEQAQQEEAESQPILSLGDFQQTRSQNAMMALLQAINTGNANQIRHFLALYQQQNQQDKSMVLFARAALAAAKNNNGEAIALYRQLLQENPDFVRGKLDLARLLFIDKQNRESAHLFAQIHVADKNQINQKIMDFQQALDNRQAWHGSFSIGALYNDNINQTSGSTIWRAQSVCFGSSALASANCQTIYLPASTPKPIGGAGIFYEGGANQRKSLLGNHAWQWGFLSFGRWYRHHVDYNEHSMQMNLAYVYQNQNNTLSIGPLYQWNIAGRHLQNSSLGLNVQFERTLSQRAFVSLQAEYKSEQFRQQGQTAFDGPQTTIFAHGVLLLPRQWVLFGGYDYLKKSSREAVDSYHRNGLRLGLNKRFGVVDIALQSSWRKLHYHGYNAWLQTQRKDWQQVHQIDLRLQLPQLSKITPTFSIRHIENKSTSWVNRYKKNEYALKMVYRF